MSNLIELCTTLKHRLVFPLPGTEAHMKMAYAQRKLNMNRFKTPADAVWSSVLILLYELNDAVHFPLIERPTYDGVHSGQVSLPGGKFEADDEHLINTALRETEEEIGVPKEDVQIIGKLTEIYIPPSNYLVHPQLAMLPYKPDFFPDEKEVVEVMQVSLDDLMNTNNLAEKQVTLSNGMKVTTPCFILEGKTVWGATAMMLSELKSILFELGY